MTEPTKQTEKEVEQRSRQNDLARVERLTGMRHCPYCGQLIYPSQCTCPYCGQSKE